MIDGFECDRCPFFISQSRAEEISRLLPGRSPQASRVRLRLPCSILKIKMNGGKEVGSNVSGPVCGYLSVQSA